MCHSPHQEICLCRQYLQEELLYPVEKKEGAQRSSLCAPFPFISSALLTLLKNVEKLHHFDVKNECNVLLTNKLCF